MGISFIAFCTSKMQKIKKYISNIIKRKNGNYYQAMLLKQKLELKMLEAKEIESEYIKKFNNALDDNYQKINNECSEDIEEKTRKNTSKTNNIITKDSKYHDMWVTRLYARHFLYNP